MLGQSTQIEGVKGVITYQVNIDILTTTCEPTSINHGEPLVAITITILN